MWARCSRRTKTAGAARDIRGESMDVESIIIWLIVGAIAGWLAGMVVKGGGYGLIGDIVVGIVGALDRRLAVAALGIDDRRRLHRRRSSTPSSAR